MRIFRRSEWGAIRDAGAGWCALPVPEVWLHHSVTTPPPNDIAAEKAAMRVLERIGQQRFKQGISYTFAVMPSGRVYEGTGAGRLGSHTGGRNSRSHGIVLVGNYEDNAIPQAMVLAVAELLRHGAQVGWWNHPRLNGGHRDLKQTACPGINAYRQIPRINELARGGPAAPPPQEEDIMASKDELREVVADALRPVIEELTKDVPGSIRDELDNLRIDMRQVAEKLGFKAKS